MNLKERCKKCNKQKGDHSAKGQYCPTGSRTRIGYLHHDENSVFEPKKKYKKRKPKITNVQHIASIPIPVDETKTDYKHVYVVGSVSEKRHCDHRSWFIAESLEKAIECMYSWSNAEVFYESGYYEYVVIQKVALNHVMPSMEMMDNKDKGQTWFKLVPEEINIENEDIRKSIVPCDVPEYFKRIIGFI